MDIYLYNTLGKKKEKFTPISIGTVKMYHCGPTVYWTQHIGNLRAVFFADIINRTFRLAGYETVLVRNYTDVGHLNGDNQGDADTGSDRMEVASKRESSTPDKVAQKYISIYEKDCKQLNILPPEHSPKATDHMAEMHVMINTLLEKGFAYQTPEAIYFDTSKKENYTELSGQKIDFQKIGSGHGTQAGISKKNPSDFALWFFKVGAHANALQVWNSPFTSPLVENGDGFPGWHIECSAMSQKYLGKTFDIHMGGIEHIPIHHTNEIAQSQSAHSTKYVNYWLHNEHLLVNARKMSKSDGSVYTMSDILEHGFTGRDLRMFFMQAHYRSKQNFTWDGLLASQKALSKIDKYILGLKDEGIVNQKYYDIFSRAILDDFNTSAALATVFEMMRDINVSKSDFNKTLQKFDQVFGLGFTSKKLEIEIPKNIIELAEKRKQAKIDKDWGLADDIRTQIEFSGYAIVDTKAGFEIQKMHP